MTQSFPAFTMSARLLLVVSNPSSDRQTISTVLFVQSANSASVTVTVDPFGNSSSPSAKAWVREEKLKSYDPARSFQTAAPATCRPVPAFSTASHCATSPSCT